MRPRVWAVSKPCNVICFFAQPMVVYSERRKRRSPPKVRLTVQNNHALRAPNAFVAVLD